MNVLDFLFKVSILQKVVLSQIVEGTRSLFENGELRFVFVTFAADEPDALLNVADEGDTPARGRHLALAVPAPLNALFDPVLGVVVSDGLCTGKTLLSLSTEGDVFSGLDFISDVYKRQRLTKERFFKSGIGFVSRSRMFPASIVPENSYSKMKSVSTLESMSS